MKCEHCEAELRAQDRFCLRCGLPTPTPVSSPSEAGMDEAATPTNALVEEVGVGSEPWGEIEPTVTGHPPVVAATGTGAIRPHEPVPAPSGAVLAPAARRIGPNVEQMLLTDWPSAIRLASLIFVFEALIHAIPGLVAALAGLVRDGVAPEPLGDFFRLPFQGLLAGGGGVAGVGLWLTSVAVTAVATGAAWRWPAQTGDPAGRLLPGLKAAVVHGVILVALSFLIEARGFDISNSIDLPGDLTALSSIDAWSRPQLFVLSTLVVAMAVIGLELPFLASRRPWLAAGVRAAVRALVAMASSVGLLVLVAAALRLPSEPDLRLWIAQGLELLASGTLALLDIGAHRLGSAVEVLFGASPVDPVRGPWVAVVIVVGIGVPVAAILRWYQVWEGPLGLAGGVAASAVPGLSLIVVDTMTGLGGELFRSAVLLAGLDALLVMALTPAAATQVRNILRQQPANVPLPAGGGLDPNQRRCRSCASPIQPTTKFCGKCGTPAT